MAGYCIIEQNLSLLNSDQVNYLGTYCEDSLVDAAKNYQNLLEEFSDEIINNSQLKEENLTIKILEAGEYQQQQMRVHQFVSLTSQELNEQYYSYQNGGTIQNESFQTIFQNQIIHQNLQFLIEKIYTSKLEDVNQNTIDSFIYFTIIVFGIFIFAIILMVPILMKIIQYQEKILLLITRIYEFETLIEVKQIQSSIHILNSQNEEWINTSFLEQEANKPAIDPSITQGKQQVLSNKIFQQSLHIYLWYILVGVKSILLTSFFGIIIILVAVYDQQLQPSLDLNTKVYLYDMYISQFTSTFELFIVTDIFENQYENFQPLDYDTLNNDLNKIYDNLTDFTTQFENYLNQEQSLINNNKINQMQSLLKNDLCTLLECTDLTDSQKSDYSNGVVGIVSSYLSMKNSQNHLLLESPSDENTSDHEEEVINYLNSQQNLTLLLKAYQIPITALQHISDTLLEANILLIKEYLLILLYDNWNFVHIIYSNMESYIKKELKVEIFVITFVVTYHSSGKTNRGINDILAQKYLKNLIKKLQNYIYNVSSLLCSRSFMGGFLQNY
ncbi:hypothetical protein PPERSA_03259 [Pseudocohnilembus persalinus]|uniref:Transmembrane protein n=1 Tax=Pseudocohnilembus persalinus TaxID=266149 RepID=A0A0V0QYT2_PSEPJ|nr:hypothetical protein PPERSA_03259 [Pseudocohnilembus persalinus]|eukprot:KRX07426.1 hypothetical protein PPERSA_03259 [Pseudocohnilembus persalinus]